jgi:hypothetical protein
MDWSLLETHFEAIVAHFDEKRNKWSRKVDRRVLLQTILDTKDVYEVARRVSVSPPRVHELADDMYRYARKLAGIQPAAARVKFPDLLPFARRLKLARLARRLDAKAMAARAGMGIRNYGLIERACRNPGLLSVMTMSRALGLSVGQLVDGDTPPDSDQST